jgi:hypothetical protein
MLDSWGTRDPVEPVLLRHVQILIQGPSLSLPLFSDYLMEG